MSDSPLALDNQPIFKVLIDGAACRFDVRINDVPILQNETGLPYDVAFPVSEWMIAGANRLSARIRPPAVYSDEYDELFDQEGYDEEESWLKLALIVKKNKEDPKAQQEIATLEWIAGDFSPPRMGYDSSSDPGIRNSERGFSPDDDGDVTVSKCEVSFDAERKEIVLSRVITMPNPHPPWLWLSGEEIPDDDGTLAALTAQYQRVSGLLSAGSVAEVSALLVPKAEEYATAYYLETEEEIEEAMALTLLMQADDLELASFGADVELQVFGDGRLARLVDEDNESPIVYVDPNDVAYYLSLTYSKIGGRWLLTR